MSVTYARAQDAALELKGISNEIRFLLNRINAFVKLNQALSIDWGNAQLPASLQEDVNGNLQGFNFSRQQVANGIGSLAQVQNMLGNQAVAQGDHLGNFVLIADAALLPR